MLLVVEKSCEAIGEATGAGGAPCSDSLIIIPKKAARCTARVRGAEGGGEGGVGRVCAAAQGDSPGRGGMPTLP